MKQFNPFEKRCIINVAKSTNPLKKKVKTLTNKIEQLVEEQKNLQNQIQAMENTIVEFTEGYTSDQLVNTTVKNGITTYTFKYPDTIIPQEQIEQDENFFNNQDNDLNIF